MRRQNDDLGDLEDARFLAWWGVIVVGLLALAVASMRYWSTWFHWLARHA